MKNVTADQQDADVIQLITELLHVTPQDITDLKVMKKGMTNRSFVFCCGSRKYIIRIPGEGTERLIHRYEEAEVYRVLKGRNLCDSVIYMDPEKGYKITQFIEDARVCDPYDEEDVRACMKKLKELHGMQLRVRHEFDIFAQISFYEMLREGKTSIYPDYEETKRRVFLLKQYIEKQHCERCLAHIDAVPDNFIFTGDGEVRLIDWEYAGMQDPHVDIAMFCIYASYHRGQIDGLIDLYFEGKCPEETRIKIYCYIAAGGLLWSNWCEYKRCLGVEFAEYSQRQYRYAREYCRLVSDTLGGSTECIK